MTGRVDRAVAHPPPGTFSGLPALRYQHHRCWTLLDDMAYTSVDGTVTVTAPAGLVTDYASVPRVFAAYVPTIGQWTRPALIHDTAWAIDVPCRRMDHRGADRLLREMLRIEGAPALLRWFTWAAVRLGALTRPGGAGTWAHPSSIGVLAIAVVALPIVALPAWAGLPVLFVLELVVWPVVWLADRRRGRYVNPPTSLTSTT